LKHNTLNLYVELVLPELNSLAPRVPDRLILPLDGSRTAEHALTLALRIAAGLDIPLRVLHVFYSIKQLESFAVTPIEWSEDADPRAVIRPPATLRSVAKQAAARSVQLEFVGRVGSASAEICKEADESEHSWLVLCSHGASGFRRIVLGSTSRTVIRTVSNPVLLTAPVEHHTERPIQHSDRPIWVLLDGTPQSESSVCHAAALAAGLGTSLELVRVAETMRDEASHSTPEDERWERPIVEGANQYLEDVRARCVGHTGAIEVRTLAGNPRVAIPRFAEQTHPSVIVLGTRKRTGIERWTYGSLADRLLDSLSIPLLLVPME
jgi:nucleotide-binding universal stress UspA family protein